MVNTNIILYYNINVLLETEWSYSAYVAALCSG